MIVLDVIIILTIMGGNISMATDEKFAKEGYNLFLGSRNAENAEKTAKELSEKYVLFENPMLSSPKLKT